MFPPRRCSTDHSIKKEIPTKRVRPSTGQSQQSSDRLKPTPSTAPCCFQSPSSARPVLAPAGSAARAGAEPDTPHHRPAEPPRPEAPSPAESSAREVSSSPYRLPSLHSRSCLWGDTGACQAGELRRQHPSSPGRPGRDVRLRHVPSSRPLILPCAPHAPGAVCS